MRLIDADMIVTMLQTTLDNKRGEEESPAYTAFESFIRILCSTPSVDAVEAEKYNELREAFVDFACSGINNVAPYCKNRRKECADEHGWCQLGIGDVCRGFNPDGEGREEK